MNSSGGCGRELPPLQDRVCRVTLAEADFEWRVAAGKTAGRSEAKSEQEIAA